MLMTYEIYQLLLICYHRLFLVVQIRKDVYIICLAFLTFNSANFYFLLNLLDYAFLLSFMYVFAFFFLNHASTIFDH
jgi:hypothetical protein